MRRRRLTFGKGTRSGADPARRKAFSLIELLVSIAVLSILVVLLTQMLGMVAKTWTSGKSQADNFTQARIALDMIARDIEAISLRPDLPAFLTGNPPTPEMAFYTKQKGFVSETNSGNRSLSRVRYFVTNVVGGSALRRSAVGFDFGDDVGYVATGTVPWSVPSGGAAFGSDIGPGVLVLRHQFIGTNGTNIPPQDVNPGWKDGSSGAIGVGNLRAIVVSLAVMDADSIKILKNSGTVTNLQGNFSTAAPGAVRSYASAWQAQLDDPSRPLLSGGVPPGVLKGLRVFETTVMLPSSQGGAR